MNKIGYKLLNFYLYRDYENIIHKFKLTKIN